MTKYIDADKLVDKMDKTLDNLQKSIKYEGLDEFINGYAEATFCVDNAPAADVVEVRHGRWVKIRGVYRCTECHYVSGGKTNYCPDCGVKKDEEE